MLKKYFDWTPRDIAYWEKVRRKGLWSFIAWYGVVITSGIFFVLFGLVTIIFWLKQIFGRQITSTSLIFLAWQLLVLAVVCVIAGLINSLITWVVEERLYRKYKARSSPDLSDHQEA